MAAAVTAEITTGSVLDVDGDVELEADNATTVTASAVASTVSVALISIALGNVTNTNLVANTVKAAITSARVLADGDVSVLATDTVSSIATGRTGSVGAGVVGVSGAGALVESTTNSTVDATVGGAGAVVDADGSVTVRAVGDIDSTVTGFATSMSAGFIAVSNAAPVAKVSATPVVRATLGGTVTGGDEIAVEADLSSSATAAAKGGSFSFGGITIATGSAEATTSLTPTVSASISGGVITSTGAGIAVKARYNVPANPLTTPGTASASAEASSGGLGASSGASSSTVHTPSVSATGLGTLSAQGAISFDTAATTVSTATSGGRSGGLVGVGRTTASATSDGTIGAWFGGLIGTAITTGAGALSISALASGNARATAQAVRGGLFANTSNSSSATASPDVRAYITDSAVVGVVNNVDVSSTARPEADAITKGTSTGALAFGGSASTATARPVVHAYIGTSATVAAGGNVSVSATLEPPTSTNTPPDYVVDGVNTSNTPTGNTLTVENHGLSTGDLVEYVNAGGTIPGLTTVSTDPNDSTVVIRRQYSVVSVLSGGTVDPDKLSFGGTFDTSKITDNTITMPGHSLATGDWVVPDVTVGGLNMGGRYFVVVIDGNTIRLVASGKENAGGTFNPTTAFVNTGASTVTIAGHGFAEGDAVIYDSPDPYHFTNSWVDVSGVDGDGRPIDDPNANTIWFLDANGTPVAHGLVVGDRVLYTVIDGTAVGGLSDGRTYRVASATSTAITLKASDKVENLQVIYTLDGSRMKITRVSGDWLADGFNANQQIIISSAETNGTYTIDQVSGSSLWLTVNTLKATQLVETFTFTAYQGGSSPTAATVTRSGRDWSVDSFTGGTTITITNRPGYNGTYTIASVSGTTATLQGTPAFSAGSSLSATISRLTTGVVSDTFDSPAIALSVTKTTTVTIDGQAVTQPVRAEHQLTPAPWAAIGSLVDGQTYYVRNVSGNSFELWSAPTGGTRQSLSISGLSSIAAHSLRSTVVLTPSTGEQTLRVDLTGGIPAGSTHRLAGPGGVDLATVLPRSATASPRRPRPGRAAGPSPQAATALTSWSRAACAATSPPRQCAPDGSCRSRPTRAPWRAPTPATTPVASWGSATPTPACAPGRTTRRMWERPPGSPRPPSR